MSSGTHQLEMNDSLRQIEIGQSSFEDLMTYKWYFVDKSRFIPDILKAANIVLITRPRRFGKTLTLSMLRSFLSLNFRNPADKSLPRKLFSNLSILKNTKFVDENMGQWPVIHLSLKDASGRTYESAVDRLKFSILAAASPFSFLADSDRLNPIDKESFKSLLNIRNLHKEEAESILANSLAIMESVLHAHYGRKAILLIDEYDVPLHQARTMGHYGEMIDLFRSIFSSGLKDSPHLHKAVLTGCLRIAKESVFTRVNNFKSFGISQIQLRDVAGFTESETQKILSDFNLDNCSEIVRENYDGYRFGGLEIYCPWDVMNFCADKMAGETVPGNYWIGTSSNNLILEFVDHADDSHLSMLRTLVEGGVVEAEVCDDMSFTELEARHSPQQLLSLLYHTGYITKTSNQQGRSAFRIPNMEILECFKQRISSYFTVENPSYAKASSELFDALITGKTVRAQKILQNFLTRFVSLRDTGSEAFYHGLVLGMLGAAVSPNNSRVLLSNREAGDGFYDIIIGDDATDTAVVLELKRAERSASTAPEDRLEAACRTALAQIEEKKYMLGLEEFKVVRRAGLAFSGKHCRLSMV